MENLEQQRTLEAQNLSIVTSGMTKALATLDITAFDDYIDDNYIQHNPMIAQGKAGLQAFMQAMIAAGAKPQKLEILRASASGDLVWVHCKLNLAGKDVVVCDIFKMKNGKAIEHWDVIQEIPSSIN
jgi:predicted SnoaL-like aldol condensation-catalyzing enzyme